jgi:hypothetical protein
VYAIPGMCPVYKLLEKKTMPLITDEQKKELVEKAIDLSFKRDAFIQMEGELKQELMEHRDMIRSWNLHGLFDVDGKVIRIKHDGFFDLEEIEQL